jgi:hypothetical protein
MKVAFACPHCDQTSQTPISTETGELRCDHCGHVLPTPEDAFQGEKLSRCLCCGSHELFIRKDFSQRLGVAIIATGFVAATITWAMYWRIATYLILFGSALLDVVLYFTVNNLLECYRCHAQYRGLPGLESYEPFSLEVHEKYRQQEIRLREAERAARNSASA